MPTLEECSTRAPVAASAEVRLPERSLPLACRIILALRRRVSRWRELFTAQQRCLLQVHERQRGTAKRWSGDWSTLSQATFAHYRNVCGLPGSQYVKFAVQFLPYLKVDVYSLSLSLSMFEEEVQEFEFAAVELIFGC
jgi:hypothetical protein